MNNPASLFQVLLLDETKNKRWSRELFAIAAVMAVILFVIPAPYIALGLQSLGTLLKGTMAAALYLSALSSISKVRDRKYKLLLSLPVDKRTFIFQYALVLWIKTYALRVMPLVLSILAANAYSGRLTLLQSVLAGAACAIAGWAASIVSIGAVLFAYERGFLRFPSRRSSMKFNWLKREFVRFASDKVLLVNHIGYSLFILFFLWNAVMVSDADSELALFLLTLLSSCSTPGVLFSYEKPCRELLLSLPVSVKSLFAGKYIFSLAITLPLYAAAYAIVRASHPAGYSPGLLAVMLCSLVLVTFIKLYYDYKRPNLNWSHTRQMFEHKRKYALWAMSMAVSATWMVYSYVSILVIIAAQLFLTWGFLFAIRKGEAPDRAT